MARRPRLSGGKPVPDRLIDAAEVLIGKFDVEGVSLRQIGTAAGTTNSYAVQYHFGDIDGLIRGIFEARMPAVNRKMQKMLADLEQQGRLGDARSLLDVLSRPLLDEVDDQGERSFARFLSTLLRTTGGHQHITNAFSLTQEVFRIIGLLHIVIPHVPMPLLQERLRLASILVYSSVFNRSEPFASMPSVDAELIDDALSMITESVKAPLSRDLATRMAGRT